MNWAGEFGHSNLNRPSPTAGLLGVCSAYATSQGIWVVQMTRVSVATDLSAEKMHANNMLVRAIARSRLVVIAVVNCCLFAAMEMLGASITIQA